MKKTNLLQKRPPRRTQRTSNSLAKRLAVEWLEDRRLLAFVGTTIDLANLGNQGFAINGGTAGGTAGYAVGPAGDLNNDGFADVVVGAPTVTADGRFIRGESYVVFGSATDGLPSLPGPASILDTRVYPSNGHTYHLLSASTWTDAQQTAEALGGNLVTVNDASEEDWLWTTLKPADVPYLWIGLHDSDRDGTFVWESGEPVTYTNWQPGQPSGGEYYGQMGYGGTRLWNDLPNDLYAGLVFGVVEVTARQGQARVIEAGALNGVDGFRIRGAEAFDRSGFSVRTAGDVNGDGVDDVLVGSFDDAATAGLDKVGQAYVVYGQRPPAPTTQLHVHDASFEVVTRTNSARFLPIAADVDGTIYGVPSTSVFALLTRITPGGSQQNLPAVEAVVGTGADMVFGFDGDIFSNSGVVGTSPNGVVRFNRVTGDSTPFWNVSDTNRADGGLVFDAAASRLYVISGASPALYALDSAGNSTLVMQSAASGVISMTQDHEGKLLALDTSGRIHRIDPVARTSSVYLDMGAAIPTYGQFRSIKFEPAARDIWFTVIDNPPSGEVRSLYRMNHDGTDRTLIATGKNLLNIAIGGRSDGVSGTAIYVSSPVGVTAASSLPDQVFELRPKASVDLAALNGTNGFQVRGQNAFDLAGRSVSSAGDVNGDGLADLIIGAPEASPNGNIRSGQAYVVFGRNTSFPAQITPSNLTGANGFVINGAGTGDYAGISVSSAGDFNGDGFDDVLIGAYKSDPAGRNQAGRAYVVFGKGSGFGPQLNLTALDGTNGFVLNGVGAGDFAGQAVGRAGDVNGDDIDDIVIGASGRPGPLGARYGEAYVVFGHTGPFATQQELSALNGANGFALTGIDPADRAGRSVDGAGDVNGDGFDDLIIGAVRGDPQGRTDAGETYLIFGKPSGFVARRSLDGLDGIDGITIQGAIAGEFGGISVAGAGDVNGDGFDDVIFGAYYADPNGTTDAGRAYVVYGQNYNPLVLTTTNLAAAPEGHETTLDIAFENYDRPHVLTIDWGDGQVDLTTVDAVESSTRATHYYADNGIYSVVVSLVDQQATSRVATSMLGATVPNAPPILTPVPTQQTIEGGSFSLAEVAAFSDAGFSNPFAPGGGTDETFTYEIDWGDGSPLAMGSATITTTGSPGSPTLGSIPAAHAFLDDGVYTVAVTVQDDDGGSGTIQFAVVVANAPPAVDIGANVLVDAGTSFLRIGSFADPGSDMWTAEVDYGDGAGFVPLSYTADKRLSLSATYATPGSRTVTVRVTDDDGGVGLDSFTVTVRSGPPSLSLGSQVSAGWSLQFGTSANDEARAMAIDAAGNAYFAGYTQGDLAAANFGSNDAILGKVDPSGNRLWTIQFGTPEGDVARGVAVDADGSVLATGDTIGSLSGPNAGETDAFLSKYTADGQRIWSRQLGTAADDLSRGVALDAEGNAYVVGGTNGDLGGTNLGGLDGFIAKYDRDGNRLWTRNLGTTGDNDSLLSVAVDAQGNVYAGGVTNGNLAGPNAGALDAFVARFDRDGNLIWTRQLGTSADEIGLNVRLDASGNVYATGSTAGSLAGPNQGGSDYHVHKFDPQGTLLWAIQDGTSAADQQRGLAVDAAGNAIVAGFTAGSLGRPSLGQNDLFLARYDASGARQSVLQFGTQASDLPWGAAVDAAGNVYLAAISAGSLGANHVGGWDVVFARFAATPIATEGTPLVAVDLATFADFDVGNYAYSIDWGDGTPASSGLATIDVTDGQSNTLKLGSFDGMHTYADNGQYHVVVRLTDPTGQTSVRSFFATVENAFPTVALSGGAAVDEGATYSLTVGPVADPGADTVSEWRIDWNDGSPVDVFTAPPGTIEHAFADGPAGRNVTVSLVDEDGIHVAATHSVSVNNVAPSVDAGESATVDLGTTTVRGGSFIDPGNDAWTAVVDYGDGGGFVPLALAADNTFALELHYVTPGTKTVQVRVTDDDGGVGVDSFQVTVEPTFLVSSFTPTSTGFVVAFNRPADPSLVNLYDGPDAEFEPADVTLVGNTVGPVAGSLVWNAAHTQFTFIKTGGPLLADSYAATLFSRAAGFVDAAGNLLDGDGDFAPGGDYASNFTVAASAARLVSLADFARGPAQAVHVPNTAMGLPIRVSDGSGVLSVDLDVVYDPALLNISSISRAAGVPTNWTVTANLTQPGRARVTASGITALAAELVDVLRIAASVPTSAPVGAAQIVRLENVRINGGLIASQADSALHKVAFLADVDGNFAYTAFDAAFISRVVVGLDTGFDAFPLVDPVVIGNSSGTGSLSGLDAAYVAQKAVFLPRPEIPDLPPNLPAPSPAAVDPAIGVPAAVFAQAGAAARVPVTVDDLSGLFGVTLRVNYETGPLDLANEQVTLAGELEAAGWSLVQNVDDGGGAAYLAAFSAQPGTAGAAKLVDLHFHSLASAVGTTPLDLSGPASDGGFAFTYIDGTLTLTTPGDVNLDGVVGIADLVALQRSFGKLVDAVWTEGDLDGDGDVDRADLAIVASNFGRRPTPSAPPQAPEAVVTAVSRTSTPTARRKAVPIRGADAVIGESLSYEPTTMSRRTTTRHKSR